VIYEDLTVGSSHAFGAHRFTAEEIRRFALAYDPQPFHLDEAAARESPFGAICASGWHTASVMMGLLSRYFAREDERARAAGRAVAALGPSPGFDDLKWLRAVYPGDTVTFTGRVTARRTSASKPGWGLVTVETTGVNQKGERVFVVTGHVFAARASRD
jgi:acyl dehydratase